MPFNLLKKYPELLEILHLGDKERKASLYRVYRRDIENNEAFKFREKRVYPIKSDGEIDMQREFMHLTTTDDKEAEGAATKKRVFEPDRFPPSALDSPPYRGKDFPCTGDIQL